jgi:hypothetical protein
MIDPNAVNLIQYNFFTKEGVAALIKTFESSPALLEDSDATQVLLLALIHWSTK